VAGSADRRRTGRHLRDCRGSVAGRTDRHAATTRRAAAGSESSVPRQPGRHRAWHPSRGGRRHRPCRRSGRLSCAGACRPRLRRAPDRGPGRAGRQHRWGGCARQHRLLSTPVGSMVAGGPWHRPPTAPPPQAPCLRPVMGRPDQARRRRSA
jgi:hypothetical protein